ncbi:MAG: hypothetical protein ACE5H8_08035 [Alphaproteobacteria bacterium]
MTGQGSRERLLARAKGYPYAAPPYSYLFVNGAAHELVEGGGDPLSEGALRIDGAVVPVARVLHDLGIRGTPGIDGRIAVLAHGSNAAPETMARKFAGFGKDAVIPVIRGRLAGFDVVYATHFSSYGSIPSTLAVSPGAEADIAVTFLTPRQLALMHRTELSALNYVYGRLDGLSLVFAELGARDAAHVYLTRHGHLGIDGAPFALAAIRARGRRFRALGKVAVLALARDHLAPGTDLDAFILETVADADLRRTRSEALRRCARPFDFAGFTPLEVSLSP